MQEYITFIQNHPLLMGGFVAILGLILFIEFQRFTQKHKDIGSQQLVKLLNDESATLIDVRENAEVKDGVIKGAKHIPLGELTKRLGELEKHKASPVVVYCRSGNRSATACRMLAKQEFAQIYNLKGGVMAWQSDNLPLAKR